MDLGGTDGDAAIAVVLDLGGTEGDAAMAHEHVAAEHMIDHGIEYVIAVVVAIAVEHMDLAVVAIAVDFLSLCPYLPTRTNCSLLRKLWLM